MKFEKLLNSKFYRVLEVLYSLIMLNLISLILFVLGLGFFSIMPTIVAMIIILRSIRKGGSFPLIKTFFKAFNANYLRVLKLSFFYLIVGIIFAFNTYFFYSAFVEYQALVNELIYYFWLVLDLIFVLSFINACFICVYFPNLNNKKVIKYSFSLLSVIPLQIVFLSMLLVFFLVASFIVPLVAIFLSISLYFFIANHLIERVYLRLVADGIKSLDVNDYYNEKKDENVSE